MSDESNPGQVASTPEAGPVAAGVPAQEPGAGQVRATPEAGPISEDEALPLQPPAWREHMRGPILGLDDQPAAPPPGPSPTGGEQAQMTTPARKPSRASADEELRKWPPYSGKPVSDVSDAMRFVAPVVAQAEKLSIQAIDLSARGLSKLARYLETRRQEREAEKDRDAGGSR
jgi:hypothetical protein